MEYHRTIPTLSDRLWSVITARGRLTAFPAGQTLYQQNAPSGGFFFLESGCVKVSHVLDNGNESIVALYGPRDLVGEASALERDSSPAAVTVTPVSAWLLPTGEAYRLIEEDGEFARYLVDMLAYKLRMANAHLCTVSGKRGAAKLAATLLLLPELGVSWDKAGWFSITHEELACFTGATRANTTSLLRQFTKAGLVDSRRGGLRLLNAEGLMELAEGASLS
ncbi:MAG: Crp/Fnr family transcriptional regulator [Oscillospiraceae bacterium]|nr:Crp/Fnr family transcriptional regulator [Oscillospiraceae bacterium]